MNRLGLVLVIAVFSLLACGQATPPDAVTGAFIKKFPTAKKVKWDKENDKEWEAEFVVGKNEMSANYDLDGYWLETEGEIEVSQLPAAVIKLIGEQFAGFKVEEALTLENLEFLGYEITLESKTEDIEIVVTKDGVLVSRTAVSEEDEKGEKGEKGEK